MRRLLKLGTILGLVAAFLTMAHALDLGKIGVKKGKGGAAAFNFDASAASQAEEFIHVSNGKQLKDIKKLGIINFTVEYTLAKKASVISRSMSGSESASAEVVIPEADPEILGKLTDFLYDRLVADIKGAGIEFIPFETLAAEKRYEKLKGAQKQSPWVTSTKDGNSAFVGAHGMPIYLDNPERADFLKGLGMSFGTNTRMHETLLANDLEGHLLSVNIVIDFADLKEKGSMGKADIETSYEQFLHAGNTRYRFIKLGQPELAMLSVKKAVLPDTNPFTDVKIGRWKRNWFALPNLDGTTTTATRETSYKFNEAIYYQNCENLVNAVNGMMMTTLYTARGLTPPESAAVPLAAVPGATVTADPGTP